MFSGDYSAHCPRLLPQNPDSVRRPLELIVMFLLDEKEKEKFAIYCEQNAESSKAIIAQFEKMPGPAMEEIAKREKQKVAAFLIVAAELRSGETMSI